jgi:hypothetical protein
MFLVMSLTIKTLDSKSLFEKVFFVELQFNQDSILFKPYSKAWEENWMLTPGLEVNRSSIMNYEKYKFAFDGRKDNLWTILHPMILEGSIPSFYPKDPENGGFGPSDDGELRYPILKMNETFVNSEQIRENMCYVLGQFGPPSVYPLVNMFGEDSLIIGTDGSLYFVYPPRDFYWFTDKSILKYKLRVSVIYNQKGKELKRIIKSISPVVNVVDENGELLGEKDLIWLNFNDIKLYLQDAYFFNAKSKPVSYLNYIEEKVKWTTIN